MALPSRNAAEPPSEVADVEQSDASTVTAPSATPSTAEQETPDTSQAPSEVDVAGSSTPAASNQAHVSSPQTQSTSQAHGRRNTRTAVPIIPALPAKPATRPKTASSDGPATPSQSAPAADATAGPTTPLKVPEDSPVASSPAKVEVPKSWADLVRAKNAGAAAAASAVQNGAAPINGTSTSRAGSVAEAFRQYNVNDDEKVAFLEPRGLVNTGNMCYMNSVRLPGRRLF